MNALYVTTVLIGNLLQMPRESITWCRRPVRRLIARKGSGAPRAHAHLVSRSGKPVSLDRGDRYPMSILDARRMTPYGGADRKWRAANRHRRRPRNRAFFWQVARASWKVLCEKLLSLRKGSLRAKLLLTVLAVGRVFSFTVVQGSCLSLGQDIASALFALPFERSTSSAMLCKLKDNSFRRFSAPSSG